MITVYRIIQPVRIHAMSVVAVTSMQALACLGRYSQPTLFKFLMFLSDGSLPQKLFSECS